MQTPPLRGAALKLRAPASPDLAAEAVLRLLELVGEDPAREGLRETPRRVVKALLEMTSGYEEDAAEILSTVFHERHEEVVTLRDIPFASLCEHHMLPFEGKATIAYLPDDRIVGLSKLARLTHCFARRLQVQERMTEEIAQAIADHLQPRGVAVVIEAEHSCMRLRGARSEGTMRTSAYRGDEDARRALREALA